jgi:hypothetical protein
MKTKPTELPPSKVEMKMLVDTMQFSDEVIIVEGECSCKLSDDEAGYGVYKLPIPAEAPFLSVQGGKSLVLKITIEIA